ncbi:MAG: hypothetical protein JNM17_25685, partial [Archangium sp.]|nr:hypothetical protein [Archangium sp.]
MKRVLFMAVLLSLSCHRVARPGGAKSLVGVSTTLVPSPALRLVVPGDVDGKSAEVTVDPASPITFVTSGCFQRPDVRGHVMVLDPFGSDESYAVVRMDGLSIDGLLLAPFEAAIAEGIACVVVLGARELEGVAIEIDPARRAVKFRASQSKDKWIAELEATGDDAQVLVVTKDPANDWPLLPVRVRQGPRSLDAVMLLSLRDSRSRLYDEVARSAGLRPGLELLEGLPLPDGLELPAELQQLRGYAFESFELAPGFGLANGSIEIEPGANPHTPQGMLGSDVWGRFHAVYDVSNGLLALRRPRVLTSGTRSKCVVGNVTSEEACFELHSNTFDGGVEFTATAWGPLPSGAQLSLDLTNATGTCRVGISFARGDRGRSTHHRLPWARLDQSLPGCVGGFDGVTGVTPGLLEEGSMPQCPGVCAWAHDALSRRISCECQPGARSADAEAEKRLLELFKKALE